MKSGIAFLLILSINLMAMTSFALPGGPKLPSLSPPSAQGGLGQPCRSGGSCDSNLVCTSTPLGQLCKPQPQGGLAQPCRPGGSCDPNLVCTSTPLGQLCKPQPPQGGLAQPCRTGRSCDAGLVCTDTPLGELCKPQPQGALGQPCRPNRQCDQGLECAGPAETVGFCIRPPARGGLGQPCRPNRQCNQGLTCTGPDAAQVCTPPAPDPARTSPPTVQGMLNKLPGMEAVNPASWPRWVAGAKQGVRTGVPQWIDKAGLIGGIINANIVSAGALAGPPLFPLISGGMKNAGAPDRIVAGFMGPVAEAWTAWAASVKIPGLAWYPTFVAFPGPVAPPTPGPVAPLKLLTQVTTPLTPAMLAQAIRVRLGRDAASPEAQAAITEFCAWFYAGFSSWLPAATIRGVIGTGGVPTFAPPAIPAGPVVGGTAAGGKISPAPVWP